MTDDPYDMRAVYQSNLDQVNAFFDDIIRIQKQTHKDMIDALRNTRDATISAMEEARGNIIDDLKAACGIDLDKVRRARVSKSFDDKLARYKAASEKANQKAREASAAYNAAIDYHGESAWQCEPRLVALKSANEKAKRARERYEKTQALNQ